MAAAIFCHTSTPAGRPGSNKFRRRDGDKPTSVRSALTDDEKVTLVWEFVGAGTDNVVYLHSVILESLRLHPPVVVIQRNVVVGGGGAGDTTAAVISMHVPPPAEEVGDGISSSGSGVVRFTSISGAIGRDGRAWTDPDEFQPERFLTGGEDEAVGPMPAPRDVRMMPFGAGTQHCPGIGLGLVHVRLLIAALVRSFRWGMPPPAAGGGGGGGGGDGAPVDLTEVDGFVKDMKTPLMACITPRA